MEVWAAKLICLVTLLVDAIVFGLLPIGVVKWIQGRDDTARRPWAGRMISYLNCLGGGVFLGVSFLHLMPEVDSQMTDIFSAEKGEGEPRSNDYPLGPLFVCAGMFFVMLFEHCVLTVKNCGRGVSVESVDAIVSHVDFNSSSAVKAEPSTPASAETTSIIVASRQTNCGRVTAYGSVDAAGPIRVSQTKPCAQTTGMYHQRARTREPVGLVPDAATGGKSTREPEPISQTNVLAELGDDQRVHGLRSLILLLALSMHTVFEGLALGLQRLQSDVWTLMGVIILHKSIIVFTLGLQLTETFANVSRVVISIVCFSCMAPIGIAIGTAVSETQRGNPATQISQAVLTAIATGTFIYVAFFEVLQKELTNRHSIPKVTFVVAGFAVIAAMMVITEPS